MWEHESWARGAYAYFAPGQMASLGPHLQTVEGRVHFAGCHTSGVAGVDAGRARFGAPRGE